MRATRPVSWLAPALKVFRRFPDSVRQTALDALTIAAERGMAGIARPMKGLGAGVFEIALPYRGDTYRLVYAVQLGADLWVLHAFQKKSTRGIQTPLREIEVIKERLRRLKEIVR